MKRINELSDNFKQPNIHVIRLSKVEGEQKKIFENMTGKEFPNLIKIYKLRDPRSSINPKHKKHEKKEKYT